LCSSWLGIFSSRLLRKEKDEASPPKLFLGGLSNFLHSSFAKSGGFFIFKNLPASRWSLNRKNRSVNFIHGTKLKDQHNEKSSFRAGIGQLVSRLQITGDFAG
jgi:hypothetical protein